METNLPEIRCNGAAILFSAGIMGIDSHLQIWEGGFDLLGKDYVSCIAEKNQLTKRQRRIIAAVAIKLWERFAE